MIEQVIATVMQFGGMLASDNKSALSVSRYLKFDGINTHLTKSKRREFFARFPWANGATVDGRFSIRISDHMGVTCRESSMFTFRLDKDAPAQIALLREMLAVLQLRSGK